MKPPVTRAEIVQQLGENLAILQQQFHVKSLSIFGSAARYQTSHPAAD